MHTGRQFDGRGGVPRIDCVSNCQIISLVCLECADEKLSPKDLNNETMATACGDEREQIYSHTYI